VKVRPQKLACWLPILLVVLCSLAMAEENNASSSSGSIIFKGKCVLCHGADGRGNTPLGKQLQAADLRSKDVQKLSDAELHQIVHDGKANMPPFADQLSDAEISHVVRYIRGLGKASKK
jgi:cytochrome c6